MPDWYSDLPPAWIWSRIFNLSRGETTVRDTAPATPPERKEATTGCDNQSRKVHTGAATAGVSMTAFRGPGDGSEDFVGSALILSQSSVLVAASVPQVSSVFFCVNRRQSCG